MNPDLFQKIIFSILATAVIGVPFKIIISYAKFIQTDHKIEKSRYYAIRRIISIGTSLLLILILSSIWGIDIKNLWVSVTGILAMIAVAFVAVWSLIANILAGFILFFTSPFKINDTIEIMPDEIKGKVLAINTFYTLISDEAGNQISVPNSLFFQKYIKKYKK